MNDLLCTIFITTQRAHLRTAGFWKGVWDAINQSPSSGCAHTTRFDITSSDNNSPDSAVSVWSSHKATAQGSQDSEGQQSLLGLFFRAPFSQESGARVFLENLGQRLGGNPDSGVSTVDGRVYRRLHGHQLAELVPKHQGMIIVNCMTPSQETETSFNRWYSEEHIPMLSAVPGWLSSTRYMLIDSAYVSLKAEVGGVGAPRYLALHEWADDGIFETMEYKAAVDTPWRTEVIASVQEKQRFILGYHGRLDDLLRNGSGDQ